MLQGLEKHGIGRWQEIGEELLPQWDDQTLRLKAARLMGSQSLARYVGWKGSRFASLPSYFHPYYLSFERLAAMQQGFQSSRIVYGTASDESSWFLDAFRVAIEQQYQKNKEIGETTGCWKSGVLVEDDNGSVRKALEGL